MDKLETIEKEQENAIKKAMKVIDDKFQYERVLNRWEATEFEQAAYTLLDFYICLKRECEDLRKRIDNTNRYIDESLIYDDFSDNTHGFGNIPETLKFYLSGYETLAEYRWSLNKDSVLKEVKEKLEGKHVMVK